MARKKYQEANFSIPTNENEIGTLSPSESLQAAVNPGMVKLIGIFGGKSWLREFRADASDDYYYNIKVREPKWYFFTKIILSLVGLGLIIAGVVMNIQEEAKPDNNLFIFALMAFLPFINKIEQPVWEEVSVI